MDKSQLRICGLDEAGRGALAGPLVLAAIIVKSSFKFEKIAPDVIVRDSKELSSKQREIAYKIIKKNCLKVDLEIISVEKINQKGINWANTEGFQRLIARNEADQYIVDGRWRLPSLGDKKKLTTCMIRADQIIPAVMSAGIVAKIIRDRIMKTLHLKYPLYGWNTNTGHGTKQHLKAIVKHGINAHHKTQFVETALRNFKNKIS